MKRMLSGLHPVTACSVMRPVRLHECVTAVSLFWVGLFLNKRGESPFACMSRYVVF